MAVSEPHEADELKSGAETETASAAEVDSGRAADPGSESAPDLEPSSGTASEPPSQLPASTDSDPGSEPSAASDSSPSSAPKASQSAPKAKKSKWRRRLTVAAISIPVFVGLLWIAVHTIPGFGPWFANTLRSVLGNRAVAWLQDTAYGVEDWVNQKTRSDDAPVSMLNIPSEIPSAEPAPTGSVDAPKGPPPFKLKELGPVHESLKLKGDGVWFPLKDPRKPNDRVRMLQTQLHPDKNRSWSVAAVVAVDLATAELHLMAGRFEPESKTKEAKEYKRLAVVPEEDRDRLMAAFNGGYKSTHGHYGMKIDGVTLVPPRGLCCAVAKYKDGSLAIRSWDKVSDTVPDMHWFRQNPICMYDEGKPHPALAMKKLGWGASSVSGTTVIRRSALGLNKERTVLYVGIGDFTTGQTIAQAMVHAGSHYVVQLDVNFSFPKFLLYEDAGGGKLKAIPLTENFEYEEDQYVGTRSHRDFFYITRREEPLGG